MTATGGEVALLWVFYLLTQPIEQLIQRYSSENQTMGVCFMVEVVQVDQYKIIEKYNDVTSGRLFLGIT